MNEGRAQTELLVVVEPGLDPAGPAALALGAEAVRLAGALPAGLRCVTWPAEPPVALEAVADALAELAQASAYPRRSSSSTPTPAVSSHPWSPTAAAAARSSAAAT